MEQRLNKIEKELDILQSVHGKITRQFDIHSACISFKFEDGAVYRVAINRQFTKATLD